MEGEKSDKETILWRTVGPCRVAVVGMAVGGNNLQALVADDLHVVRAVALAKEDGSIVWRGDEPELAAREEVQGFLRKEAFGSEQSEPPTCPHCNKPILAVRQMTMAYRQLERRGGEWEQIGEVEFGYPDTDVFRHEGEGGCQTTFDWWDWHPDAEEAGQGSEPDWKWPPVQP